MKPRRGERVMLSFTLGNPGQLETMLWNMRSRAVVDGAIACTISGVRLTSWDTTQEEVRKSNEEFSRKRALDEAERKRIYSAIDAELQRDPTRSDEAIAALIPGTTPVWIKYGRDRIRVAAISQINIELERDPGRSNEELAVLLPGCDPAWFEQARERLRWHRMREAKMRDKDHESRTGPRLVARLSR